MEGGGSCSPETIAEPQMGGQSTFRKESPRIMKIVVETESTILWACDCITSENHACCYCSGQPFKKLLQTRKLKIFLNYYMAKSPSVFKLKLFLHSVFCNDISNGFYFPHFTDPKIKAWKNYSDSRKVALLGADDVEVS